MNDECLPYLLSQKYENEEELISTLQYYGYVRALVVLNNQIGHRTCDLSESVRKFPCSSDHSQDLAK